MRIKKYLQRWLEIKEPINPALNKDLEQKVEQLKGDLDYWHRTFRSFSVLPCAYCGKQMRVYPYGGAYYRIKGDRKVHATCYDDYLEQKERKK